MTERPDAPFRLQMIGGGKMAEALLGGLLRDGWAAAAEVHVVEPSADRRAELAAALPGLSIGDQPIAGVDAVIAVKPNIVPAVLPVLAAAAPGRVLSIAAGVTTAAMEAELPADTAVVRCTPNTPALVGQGMAAIVPGTAADASDLAWAEGILAAVGRVVTVAEPELDAVTGVSGSGPAYVFHLAEALTAAGIAEGLSPEVADTLTRQTLLGAATLLSDSGEDPAVLRRNVTSPGGTTQAGLEVFAAHDFVGLVARVVEAAAERSRGSWADSVVGVTHPPRYDTISFLSDYGLADEFVGVVHSVIRSIAPHVAVVDVTHGITRHDTRAGGLALARAANYLNPGVVVAVVDPGVGTSRRAIAVEVGDGMSVLVGPDNGVLAPAVGLVGGATRAVEITNPDLLLPPAGGATFDGRDVFAPAAAHLCNGVPLTDLGPEVDPAGLMPGVLPISRFEPGERGDELICEVLWVDHFGNCQLNVDPLEIIPVLSPGGECIVRVGDGPSADERVGVRVDAFDEVPAGRVGLLVDSNGLLALVVARGSAAADLSLGEGIEIRMYPLGEADGGNAGGVVTPVQLGSRPPTSGDPA